ncbi:hypothetical protein [Methylobacterium gnaphalii]|uniref:Mu-like prophage FluMu N-terminal domain-containing protein n=1 Tax=Methylobacterium gnaphalii TaxID=1010610 RepID=A0A512JMD4_9HYPH|nr:hypothetical protein [Methylobacterium gnaphalii]GEP11129.1 hypothetical protein MGN01_29740 [Methylobacterium gnaphalii]GJD69917.1 hypothetical protein MMMDOFMJ_2856 [Methylobacterium gnaphalii]GLS50407.1 hypothetical protein GCM10007885_32590 [Methylobacterium gnaphalii]
MKTVRITETFDGYPNGKDERRFTKGDEPEVSDAFADLIIGKGLAKEIDPKPAPAAIPASPKKDADA